MTGWAPGLGQFAFEALEVAFTERVLEMMPEGRKKEFIWPADTAGNARLIVWDTHPPLLIAPPGHV
jgi:hypothetical protein